MCHINAIKQNDCDLVPGTIQVHQHGNDILHRWTTVCVHIDTTLDQGGHTWPFIVGTLHEVGQGHLKVEKVVWN